jgi:transaldolase
MHPILKQLADQGQSIWYDNIRRGMLTSGGIQALIDEGVTGVTSNPTIFQKAICESGDYDEALQRLVAAGRSAPQIYDALTLEDIRMAADLFRPVHDRTEGRDGYVSIEVNPRLAYDTEQTLAEARRIFRTLGRPNVMIKIPGTEEGLPAVEAAIAEGINVNVTLIFSGEVYERVMEAYLNGLQRFIDAGNDPAKVSSVASFFVSRVDTAVDARLRDEHGTAELQGQAAVANTKLAYRRYEKMFNGPRFVPLRGQGARVQRPLWASTSTKNPSYSPTLYVDTLIGRDTVNTVPPATLEAIKAGIPVEPTLTQSLDQAQETANRLESAGISMKQVTGELRAAGVEAFADSFDKLLEDIEAKRAVVSNALS